MTQNVREEGTMDNRKWDAVRGSIGFYATLTVCLLAAGISGYFLLTERNAAAPEQAEAPPDAAVSAPAPAIREEPSPEPAAVITPEPPAEETASMPELPVPDDTPVAAEAPRIIVSPLQGEVLAAFSVDQLTYNPTLEDWRVHTGMDISAEKGTSVLAASAGTVLSVEADPLMGTTVVLRHNGGYQTTYASLQDSPAVEVGDSVSAGQIIGTVGTAPAEAAQGPHLHFSVEHDGDAIDPKDYLNQ